jgi:hypothetical protein
MRETGLARFSQIENDTASPVDAVARRIGRADQAEPSLILQRSIGAAVAQPCIEPAARNVEETAHDSRLTLATMGVDERVLHSDTLQSALITHGPSSCPNDHQQVSVKAWEVQVKRLGRKSNSSNFKSEDGCQR